MSESIAVLVPDVGDFHDIPVIEILVSPGDSVRAEDPLVTLESDKAVMDVPAPREGIVETVHVAVGDTVSEGHLLVTLQAQEASPVEETEAEAPPPSPVENVAADPGPPNESETPLPEPLLAKRPPPAVTLDGPLRDKPGRHHATPSVRRFARVLGADLALITGTGRKGRVLKEDVEGFVQAVLSAPGGGATGGAGIPPIPLPDFSKFGEVETRPLSRIKRLSGPHLHRAWVNIPHVTHHDEVDVTELEAFRQSLKTQAEKEGVRITVVAFLLKALAAALKAFPTFNASLDTENDALILKHYINVGVAVDTPLGLVVPVVRDVDKQGLFDIARALGEVSARARDGKLRPEDIQGGCISLSSLGGIGGTAFTPIVNAPEVAILGATRSRMRPMWNGEAFVPRLMLPLDLSYDHRVIDGAEAARFMAFLADLLVDVRRLLL